MKKTMMLYCLLLVSGCATIQGSRQVKIAPEPCFSSLPRIIVIALPAAEKGKEWDTEWEEWYRGLVGEEWAEEGQKILCQTFQKKLGPEFKVLKEPPPAEEYLLVKMEIGKPRIDFLSAVITSGQYSRAINTRLAVLVVSKNYELISQEASTLEHGFLAFDVRTQFRDAIRKSGAKAADILKSKIKRKEDLR